MAENELKGIITPAVLQNARPADDYRASEEFVTYEQLCRGEETIVSKTLCLLLHGGGYERRLSQLFFAELCTVSVQSYSVCLDCKLLYVFLHNYFWLIFCLFCLGFCLLSDALSVEQEERNVLRV